MFSPLRFIVSEIPEHVGTTGEILTPPRPDLLPKKTEQDTQFS
jgi:hypothetical protein